MVLLKENHMQLTEAATLDRKSGEAERSAVPRTFRGNVFDSVVSGFAVSGWGSHTPPEAAASFPCQVYQSWSDRLAQHQIALLLEEIEQRVFSANERRRLRSSAIG